MSTIKVLFFGDIVGSLGREAVKAYLSQHREKDSIDFVIANGENTTHGHGCSLEHYRQLKACGIDCITSGNHFFNNPDSIKCASEMQDQIRPYNLDPAVPGKGVKTFTLKNGVTISVINLIGRVFLPMTQSNPFYALDEILKTLNSDIIFVDFHAEATAEKRCLAEYAKGRVTAVIGTHTHVQTNDAKILANGTFFLTDAGMNGAYDSSLGVELDSAIYRTVTGIPSLNAIPRKGRKLVNAVSLVIDIEQKKVIEYSLINEVMC